ncbi:MULTISPECIES: BlaI/MecI/CopY family transcriptional regulator [Bacillaceae]|uniref:BlaI/MecI/CopY family transcriptional regulator n=1 Tax=Bacillaceae TaxID=186817 RepID=UPI001E49C63E|nr:MULTISPECIES: BlaI/MecI/CopY family transcriptional regulator [Bacillaceae]MCE4048081.1 BlaI/MecI/CopY family transcriptional regulator [Bacillus sp. Au-Bac7]MCM3032659.1 BlaI/MecI/CopY family transcriptional regulator [Niallia sp. MER 6]MDL0434394.1 BlaI/MecI/CopY family transcriptional regulator [Niallia sp. SS-2023]UPO89138.1 BlaI/MecI/CopY family transcriptional regulator [Niallia sp. Man26]
MRINKFKVHEKGLNRFFGPLEAKIMELLWEKDELSIKKVQLYLEPDKTVSFNTVMTVMNRLTDKGFLQKRHEGRTSLYSPILTRDDFLNKQSKELTHELMDEFGSSVVVNHMLDALQNVDEGLVAKLEQKIKDLKKDR